MKRLSAEDHDLTISNPAPGINVMIRKLGERLYAPPDIQRQDHKPPLTPEELDRVERDAWNYSKEQLKKASGMSDEQAEAEIRKVREAVLARIREDGK